MTGYKKKIHYSSHLVMSNKIQDGSNKRKHSQWWSCLISTSLCVPDIYRAKRKGTQSQYHIGSVWMSPLESSVLNWPEFQISEETEMGRIRIHLFGCPANWPLKCLWDFNTESCLDDKLWNCIATLPGYTLFYITQKWNLTMNECIAIK